MSPVRHIPGLIGELRDALLKESGHFSFFEKKL
jgi:hypothetical protein